MHDNFYTDLRIHFKNKNLKKISEKTYELLTNFSDGYLRNKLRVHPLGFLFCRLHCFDNDETIRVHIWLDKENIQKPLMDIHNHFYNIISYIVTGAVSNTLYKVSKEEPLTHATYVGSYQSNEKRILSKKNEFYQLEEIETQIINEGELYTIGKSEVHKGDSIDDSISISIVYTEEPGNPSPLVFGPIAGLDEYTYSSLLVDKQKIIELEKEIKCLTMAKKS